MGKGEKGKSRSFPNTVATLTPGMLKAALPNETRHPRSLPPTIDLKDLIVGKVWSSADHKPIAQREKVMPPTPRLSLPLLQGNWTTTDWCGYTSDTGEEEGGEKCVVLMKAP